MQRTQLQVALVEEHTERERWADDSSRNQVAPIQQGVPRMQIKGHPETIRMGASLGGWGGGKGIIYFAFSKPPLVVLFGVVGCRTEKSTSFGVRGQKVFLGTSRFVFVVWVKVRSLGGCSGTRGRPVKV